MVAGRRLCHTAGGTRDFAGVSTAYRDLMPLRGWTLEEPRTRVRQLGATSGRSVVADYHHAQLGQLVPALGRLYAATLEVRAFR